MCLKCILNLNKANLYFLHTNKIITTTVKNTTLWAKGKVEIRDKLKFVSYIPKGWMEDGGLLILWLILWIMELNN